MEALEPCLKSVESLQWYQNDATDFIFLTSVFFIVNFEQISHIVLRFPFFILNK